MKDKIVHASDVKPDFKQVKKAWAEIISIIIMIMVI